MNRKEISSLIAIATANFPSMQERDMRPTAALWEKALADMPYDVAEKAVVTVLSTSKFFPTIAEIREAATQLTQPRVLDAMEAWGLIATAIRKYGFYDQENGLASLPPDVRAIAKRFGWRELCHNTNPDTLRAQFRMAWETNAKREREYQQLPAPIREVIEGVAEKFKMIEG